MTLSLLAGAIATVVIVIWLRYLIRDEARRVFQEEWEKKADKK